MLQKGSGYSMGVIYRCGGDTRAFCLLSVPKIPGTGFPLGMLWGALGTPQVSGTLLCLFMTLQSSSVQGAVGARALAFLTFEVLLFEVPDQSGEQMPGAAEAITSGVRDQVGGSSFACAAGPCPCLPLS